MDVLRGLFWVLVNLLRGLWWLTVKSSRLSARIIRWALAQRRSTTFGSARWAGWWDVLRGGAWGERGLIVGRFWGRFLRYHGDGAMLVYAPQGSGKGVGIVVPNILDHKGSLIVTDPKGENAGVTARYRASLGPVYQLNVIDPLLSDQFNPLSMVRQGTLFEAEDMAMLADLLVVPESHDAHWDTSAKNLIAAVIGYVLHSYPPELQNLSTVRELVAADTAAFQHTLEQMVATGISTIAEEAASILASDGSDESLSVKKNAAKALLIWSRDRIGGRLASRSDFDMLDLHRGVVTVYVIVPEDLLKVYAPFMRVMMGCAVVAMVRAKGFARPAHKPLLLFDECAALRRLDVLASGMGYLREYARTILVFQDLGQLQEHYGVDGARTFVAASGAQVAFDVNDNTTGRELSDTIGMTTVRASSDGLSQANTDLFRHQQQAGRSEAGRALKDPAEIRNLPRSRALVFLSTVRAPILARKIRYYRERRWHGLWDRWRDPATVTPLVPAASPPTQSQAAA